MLHNIKKIEDLKEQFDASETARKLGLDFRSYALLYRYKEGLKGVCINDSLYMSRRTLQRCKDVIVKSFKANSFEQALIVSGYKLFHPPEEQ